jgi:hypothetical protein
MAGAAVAAESSDERYYMTLEVRNFVAIGFVESAAGRGDSLVSGDAAAHSSDETGTAAQQKGQAMQHGSICLLQPF